MMGSSHGASGAAVWLAGCALAPVVAHHHVGLVYVAIGAGVATISAYVPDIDHPSSKAARSLGPITWILAKLVGHASAAVHAWTKTAKDRPDEDGHRTCSHTLLAGLVVAGAVALTVRLCGSPSLVWLAWPVLVGYIAHLLGDSLTNSGCPILWPIKIAGRRWFPIGPPAAFRFGTGGWVERFVAMPVFAIGILVSGGAIVLAL